MQEVVLCQQFSAFEAGFTMAIADFPGIGAVMAGLVTAFSVRELIRIYVSSRDDDIESRYRSALEEIETAVEGENGDSEAEQTFTEDVDIKLGAELHALASYLGSYVGDLHRRLGRLERQTRTIETRRFALLRTYHDQGLAQSRTSFRFSLALATFGFVLISGSALIALARDGDTNVTVGLVSGSVVEAVSALFITQSNRARRLMQDFFEGLREDAKREEAVEIARLIEDTTLRSSVQAAISLQLMGASFATSDLPGFAAPYSYAGMSGASGDPSRSVARGEAERSTSQTRSDGEH